MNRHSGVEIVAQQTERLEGRHWVRRLGNEGLVCSYFLLPPSEAIPLPTDHTALIPGPRLGRKEEQPGRDGEESLGGLQCLLLPSGPQVCSTAPRADEMPSCCSCPVGPLSTGSTWWAHLKGWEVFP